ncbi:MAG: hypothetical protein IJO51_01290 [Clostridia bacterium]|nr:hypothetical protein [Clostridia bacterium]
MEMLIGLVLVVTGICNIIDPHLAWKMGKWEYKDVEPSDEGLQWTRISGFILIAAGLYFFWQGINGPM